VKKVGGRAIVPGAKLPSRTDFVASSQVRLKLLMRLTEESHTPSELASLEKKHVSHVSRALNELRQRGLVESIQSDSREKYYRATAQGYWVYTALVRRIH
jgi:DNA-binding transcriptional ArsR family regulator